MKRTKKTLKIIATLCVFFFLLSCDLTVSDSEKSSSVLLFVRILGVSESGDEADYLQSDVVEEVTIDDEPRQYVTADIAMANLEAQLKNPAPLLPGASYQTSVVVDRYTVTYTAVDPPASLVPRSFEGALSARIEIDGTVDIPFIIVREIAKWEPPLSDLWAGGMLQVVATVTFYGHDANNYPVETTGYLSIYFVNYADDL